MIDLKKVLLLAILIFPLALIGQGSKIGVRAGLNFSQFQGPLEQGESFSLSNGFHFGINYSYYLSKYFGFRGEIVYNQKGNTQNYEGDAFYILRRNAERIVDFGTVLEYTLEDSNAYISLPLSATVQLTNKIELYGGVSLDFLIGPRGVGVLDYISTEDPAGIFFIQSFDNNYYTDEAAAASFFSNTTTALIVDGDRLDIPRIAAAYYFFDEKLANKYKTFDIGLQGGFNYFINKGFYVGANFYYGLRDVSNNRIDVSLRELNPFTNFSDDSYVRRSDRDTQLSLQVSIGFRF